MSDRDSSLGGFMKGIFWGGVIGAALGIAFAPKPGEETRKDLKKKGKELEKKAKKYLDNFEENWDDNKEEIKKRVSAVSSVIGSQVSNLTGLLDEDNLKQTVDSGREAITKAQQYLNEVWEEEMPQLKKKEEPAKRVSRKPDSDEVELARKVLSKAAGRSFYKKGKK